jgi:hypothetical protein
VNKGSRETATTGSTGGDASFENSRASRARKGTFVTQKKAGCALGKDYPKVRSLSQHEGN